MALETASNKQWEIPKTSKVKINLKVLKKCRLLHALWHSFQGSFHCSCFLCCLSASKCSYRQWDDVRKDGTSCGHPQRIRWPTVFALCSFAISANGNWLIERQIQAIKFNFKAFNCLYLIMSCDSMWSWATWLCSPFESWTEMDPAPAAIRLRCTCLRDCVQWWKAGLSQLSFRFSYLFDC